jgi:asparagine synthase (glutamine-hydrolysing)
MRYLEPDMPIHTFSYVARGSEVDEEYWVDLVNSHVQATPHKVLVSSDELIADLDDLIFAQGEPFGSTSIYAQYKVFKLAHHFGITVILDGQGADELLAGYRGYPGPRLHSLVERRQWLELFMFLRSWSQWPGRSISFGVKALIGQLLPERVFGTALKLVGRDPAPSWINLNYLRKQRIRLPCRYSPDEDDAVGRRLMSALRQSLTGHGLNSLLRHGDRNSMCWSIESRVPFLTIDMAEFLLSLPEDFLISPQGRTKHIFREAMRGIVPDEILDRKDKVGFATPEQVWLQHLGNKVFDWMNIADDLPFLNAAACRAEVTSIISGAKPFNFAAWRLINYCRWLQLQRRLC